MLPPRFRPLPGQDRRTGRSRRHAGPTLDPATSAGPGRLWKRSAQPTRRTTRLHRKVGNGHRTILWKRLAACLTASRIDPASRSLPTLLAPLDGRQQRRHSLTLTGQSADQTRKATPNGQHDPPATRQRRTPARPASPATASTNGQPASPNRTVIGRAHPTCEPMPGEPIGPRAWLAGRVRAGLAPRS